MIEGVRAGEVAQSDLHNVTMSQPHTIPRHFVSLGHLCYNDFQCSAEEETTLNVIYLLMLFISMLYNRTIHL